jgi:hypothetical protein
VAVAAVQVRAEPGRSIPALARSVAVQVAAAHKTLEQVREKLERVSAQHEKTLERLEQARTHQGKAQELLQQARLRRAAADVRTQNYNYSVPFQHNTVSGKVAANGQKLVKRMWQLRFLSSQYVAFLTGYSDDPGPEPYPRNRGAAFGSSAGIGELSGMGGSGMSGMGTGMSPGTGTSPVGSSTGSGHLTLLLPEGIDQIFAYPMLNALLIQGTEEGVDKFIDLLQLLDKKPQQVVIEYQIFDGIPADVAAKPKHTGSNGALFFDLNDWDWAKSRVIDAGRLATSNLMPTASTWSVSQPGQAPQSQVLVMVPRINGDGTITLELQILWTDLPGAHEPLAGAPDSLTTVTHTFRGTVCVRDGETFGTVLDRNGSKSTIVVRAKVIHEAAPES